MEQYRCCFERELESNQKPQPKTDSLKSHKRNLPPMKDPCNQILATADSGFDSAISACDLGGIASLASVTTTKMQQAMFLHDSCQLFPKVKSVVQSALFLESEGIRRPCHAPGRCSFPLNIALENDATLDVIELLAMYGPDVLLMKDGNNECGSLSIALSCKRELPILRLLLLANPHSIYMTDNRSNYPLHVACMTGASLDIVVLLHSAFPNAVNARNFNDETPLDIAQRFSRCTEDVINYLQSVESNMLEEELGNILDDII